jgi:hypothetical protein
MSTITISDGLSPVIQGDTIQVFAGIATGFQKKPILKKFTVAIYGDLESPAIHVEVEGHGEMDDLKAIFMLGLHCMNTYQIMEQRQNSRPN